ncbi:hypothetical protein [Streptomyces sp. NPDC006875]|uniref:hypothetical protein n=1 Tax=Streptomyces sp. NPDC006875 TaxID=3154781 RepID=UPI0033CF42AE
MRSRHLAEGGAGVGVALEAGAEPEPDVDGDVDVGAGNSSGSVLACGTTRKARTAIAVAPAAMDPTRSPDVAGPGWDRRVYLKTKYITTQPATKIITFVESICSVMSGPSIGIGQDAYE